MAAKLVPMGAERSQQGRETKFRVFTVGKLNILSSKHFALNKYGKILEVIISAW